VGSAIGINRVLSKLCLALYQHLLGCGHLPNSIVSGCSLQPSQLSSLTRQRIVPALQRLIHITVDFFAGTSSLGQLDRGCIISMLQSLQSFPFMPSDCRSMEFEELVPRSEEDMVTDDGPLRNAQRSTSRSAAPLQKSCQPAPYTGCIFSWSNTLVIAIA
jgi:hypothetical protein